MKSIVEKLNKASKAYYVDDNPIMTDAEYDILYDRLLKYEKETGIIYANSPTQKVQGTVLNGFTKVEHTKPMLSAEKTTNIDEFNDFAARSTSYCSYKLDGITLVVRYSDGKFVQAVTRGNGIFGEDVTEQAKMIINLPINIPFRDNLELRGECVISWDHFNEYNASCDGNFKHPRNLAAGSIRTLDTNTVKSRNLEFVVFECVQGSQINSKSEQLTWLETLGFTTVKRMPYLNNMDEIVRVMTAENSKYPVDGLVIEYDDVDFSAGRGATAHHERCRLAYKWAQQMEQTVLTDIKWQVSRYGELTPVAEFEPVILDDTEVSKALLHNITYIKNMKLGIGDYITVYKANQIIPQLYENITQSNTYSTPRSCPCCGSTTFVKESDGVETLHCSNQQCSDRVIEQFVWFVSKNGMNIDGLGTFVLTELYRHGLIKNFEDIYTLSEHKDEIVSIDGIGEKKFNSIVSKVESNKCVKLENFLIAIGIPTIGKSAAKIISQEFDGDWSKFENAVASGFDFSSLDSFGEVINHHIHYWYNSDDTMWRGVLSHITFERHQPRIITNDFSIPNVLGGKKVVITGTLSNYTRSDLIYKLERVGATIQSAVNKNTDYLICGEKAGSKLKKAQDLGVAILNEDQLVNLLNLGGTPQ